MTMIEMNTVVGSKYCSRFVLVHGIEILHLPHDMCSFVKHRRADRSS